VKSHIRYFLSTWRQHGGKVTALLLIYFCTVNIIDVDTLRVEAYNEDIRSQTDGQAQK
jgi:hypothetical protein